MSAENLSTKVGIVTAGRDRPRSIQNPRVSTARLRPIRQAQSRAHHRVLLRHRVYALLCNSAHDINQPAQHRDIFRTIGKRD